MRDVAHFDPGGTADIAREIARLEAEFVYGSPVQSAAIEPLLERIGDTGDPLLTARIFCLLARVQIAAGKHEEALLTADDGLRAIATREARGTSQSAAVHAELLRATGAAFSKLGRIAEALPALEEAVRVAESGLDATSAEAPFPSIISPASALLRSLVTLGVSLFAIREIDTSIELYYRAMRIAHEAPHVHDHFDNDVLLVRSNLTDALHERIRRRRAAGDNERADEDVEAARRLLDPRDWHIEEGATSSEAAEATGVDTFRRSIYFAALGHHLLITAQPAQALATFERQLAEIGRLESIDHWATADAHASMAQALLELGSPRAALEQCTLALSALDRHDESNTRAAVLLARATAHSALGEHGPAYAALVEHHDLRARLEAVSAHQYASHMTAQLGLERARADVESHRRIATMLATLGQIGQELTSSLDTDAVFHIFARHVGTLLHATAFSVWFLDSTGERLKLAFGVEEGRPIQAADIFVDDTHSPAACAVRERRDIYRAENASNPRITRIVDGTRPMHSSLCTPLIVADRVFGVVLVQSERADAYHENERSIFRTLCTYAAIALDNAAAYAKLEQTVIALQAIQVELARQTAEFERLSLTDSLTGVANRRHLNERAQVEIATVRRKRSPLAVVMFDIDNFKNVNDTYGHAVGDTVLRRIANVAKEWLRPPDLIARVGGEEFALLLPGVGLPEAVAIAERIRASIAGTSIESDDVPVRVTSSFGVATFDDAAETLDAVMRLADAALYSAKQAGRDRVHAAPGT